MKFNEKKIDLNNLIMKNHPSSPTDYRRDAAGTMERFPYCAMQMGMVRQELT